MQVRSPLIQLYLILPAIVALAYLANGKVTTPAPAASAPADQPALAAAPEVPKEPRRIVPNIDVSKPARPEQALIDDTQRPLVNPLLRAQGVSPGRYWIEGLANNYFVLLDTQTGQCWIRNYTDPKWKDLGSPAQ